MSFFLSFFLKLSVCYFVLLNLYWGIFMWSRGFIERAKGDAPTIQDRWRPNLTMFPFLKRAIGCRMRREETPQVSGSSPVSSFSKWAINARGGNQQAITKQVLAVWKWWNMVSCHGNVVHACGRQQVPPSAWRAWKQWCWIKRFRQ